MDVTTVMVQQAAQQAELIMNLVKQADSSDKAVLSLMQVAEQMMEEVAATASHGNNVNMIL